MKQFSLKLVFATLILLAVTSTLAVSQEQGQQAQSPCDSQQEDSYSKTMQQLTKDTSATEAEAAEIQKFKSLFNKNKQNSTNAQATSAKAKPAQAANNQGSTGSQLLSSAVPGGGSKGSTGGNGKPCPSDAAGTKVAKNSFAEPGTNGAGATGAGKGEPHPAATGNGTLQSLTLLPNGKYALTYTAADTQTENDILLKKVAGSDSNPANPNDGTYRDDKNYYQLSGKQITVTPVAAPTK
ncbi:MAG TPA: hypothetical protein VK976_08675 [Verrucomicrobiae bacterium]|jgi:hypothetical protein|nr:hypothetical protein [Verrucomicrobiae bacterium]